MKIKKGDTVKVIAGKDKDKTGKVVSVDVKNNRVVVEGVNMITKHEKPSMSNQQGGIVNKEAPIHVSNVAFYDSKSKSAVKLGYKVSVDENGNETKEVKKIIGTTKPKIQISKGDDCFVITATDESGIDKVVIKRTSDNKSFTMKAKDNEKEYKCEFPLEEGENRIEITVYNINGATEQAKAKLTKK